MTENNDLAFDAGIDVERTARVELVHPTTGEPLVDDKGEPFWLDVRCAQSDAFQRKVHEIQGRYSIKAKNNTGPNKGKLTFEQEKQLKAEVYAATIVDWKIGKKNGGAALKLEPTWNNVLNWCLANPILRQQVTEKTDDLTEYLEAGDGGNFTKETSSRSSKRSGPKSGLESDNETGAP